MERFEHVGVGDLPHEAKLIGSGITQEVTPHRQTVARTQLEADEEYAKKAGVHLWIVILTHRATDRLLDTQDGSSTDLPILDVDTLTAPPYVGCYVCETPYEPRLRRRRCPGEPSPG